MQKSLKGIGEVGKVGAWLFLQREKWYRNDLEEAIH